MLASRPVLGNITSQVEKRSFFEFGTFRYWYSPNWEIVVYKDSHFLTDGSILQQDLKARWLSRKLCPGVNTLPRYRTGLLRVSLVCSSVQT